MKLNIQTLTGETMEVEVEEDSTVKRLKVLLLCFINTEYITHDQNIT